MNAEAAAVLYEAERQGVRQIKGKLSDMKGGVCAGMVLWQAFRGETHLRDTGGMKTLADPGCPLCGVKETQILPHGSIVPLDSEWRLVVHYNDDHGLTFSEIARKLGPDSV